MELRYVASEGVAKSFHLTVRHAIELVAGRFLTWPVSMQEREESWKQ